MRMEEQVLMARTKLTVQDVLDIYEEAGKAHDLGAYGEVSQLKQELKDKVLLGIQNRDFQGLTATVVARLALSLDDHLKINNS
jgi:hypothetical protein